MTHFPTSTPKQLYPGDQNYYEGDYPLGTCVADPDAWSNVQMAEYSAQKRWDASIDRWLYETQLFLGSLI